MLSLLVTSRFSSSANTERLKQQRFHFLPVPEDRRPRRGLVSGVASVPGLDSTTLCVSLCGLMPVGTEGG